MNYFTKDFYKSEEIKTSLISKLFPTLILGIKSFFIVFNGSRKAKRGKYDDEFWEKQSFSYIKLIESLGGKYDIEGLENIKGIQGPVVFAGNHMSTLETFVLPCIINPIKKVTFVVKKELIEMPIFRWIMKSRNPVVVGRDNPKEDLLKVINDGVERLRQGTSIVIFPQTTRSVKFDPNKFNSIAIKLAKNANVPIIPLALKTDAWGNGKLIKDFGKFDRKKTIHFSFGKPLFVTDRGTEQQKQIIDFITSKLREWS